MNERDIKYAWDKDKDNPLQPYISEHTLVLKAMKRRISHSEFKDPYLSDSEFKKMKDRIHKRYIKIEKTNKKQKPVASNTDEDDRLIKAISEALRYGCSLTPIVDWLVERSAGDNGERLRAILETISHTTFPTNYYEKPFITRLYSSVKEQLKRIFKCSQ